MLLTSRSIFSLTQRSPLAPLRPLRAAFHYLVRWARRGRTPHGTARSCPGWSVPPPISASRFAASGLGSAPPENLVAIAQMVSPGLATYTCEHSSRSVPENSSFAPLSFAEGLGDSAAARATICGCLPAGSGAHGAPFESCPLATAIRRAVALQATAPNAAITKTTNTRRQKNLRLASTLSAPERPFASDRPPSRRVSRLATDARPVRGQRGQMCPHGTPPPSCPLPCPLARPTSAKQQSPSQPPSFLLGSQTHVPAYVCSTRTSVRCQAPPPMSGDRTYV